MRINWGRILFVIWAIIILLVLCSVAGSRKGFAQSKGKTPTPTPAKLTNSTPPSPPAGCTSGGRSWHYITQPSDDTNLRKPDCVYVEFGDGGGSGGDARNSQAWGQNIAFCCHSAFSANGWYQDEWTNGTHLGCSDANHTNCFDWSFGRFDGGCCGVITEIWYTDKADDPIATPTITPTPTNTPTNTPTPIATFTPTPLTICQACATATPTCPVGYLCIDPTATPTDTPIAFPTQYPYLTQIPYPTFVGGGTISGCDYDTPCYYYPVIPTLDAVSVAVIFGALIMYAIVFMFVKPTQRLITSIALMLALSIFLFTHSFAVIMVWAIFSFGLWALGQYFTLTGVER